MSHCNQCCDGVLAATLPRVVYAIHHHHRRRRLVRSFLPKSAAAARRILVILAICNCLLFDVVQAGYFVNPANGCDGSSSDSATQGGGGPAGGLRDKEFHDEVDWAESGMNFVVNGNAITDSSSQNVVLDNSKMSYDLATRPSDPSMMFNASLIRILVQRVNGAASSTEKPIFTFEPSANVQPTDSTIAWECDALAGDDVAGVMYIDDEQPKSSVTGALTLTSIPTQDLLILVDVTVVLFEPADTTLLSTENPIRYTYQFFTLSIPGSDGGTTSSAPIAASPPPPPAPVPVSTPQPILSPVTSEPASSSAIATMGPTKAPATKRPTSALPVVVPQAPMPSPTTSVPKAPTRNPSTTIPATANPTKFPTRLPTIAIGGTNTTTTLMPSATPSLRSRTLSPTLRPSVAPTTTTAIPAPATMASGNVTATAPTTPTVTTTAPLTSASPAATVLLDGGVNDKASDAVTAQSSTNQTVLLASIIGGVVIVVVGLVVFAVLRRTRLQLQHYPNTMEMSSASKAQLPLPVSPQDDTSNTHTGSNEHGSAIENSLPRLAHSSDGRKVKRRGSPTEKVDSTESSPDDSISDVTRTWTASSITPVSVEHAINAKQIGDYAAGAAAVANLEYKDQARTVVAVHEGSSAPKTTTVSPTETRHDNENRPTADSKELDDFAAAAAGGLAFKDQARTVVALRTMSSTPGDSHNGPATSGSTSNAQTPTPSPPLPPPVAVAVATSASSATSTPIAQATLMNEDAGHHGDTSDSDRAGTPVTAHTPTVAPADRGGIPEQKRPTIDP